ncbi:hypothetical protein EZM10_24415 [Salmonella enterica]|jgi:hypothetical protein|nr:hypothetical protein [Salmonella enterica]ECQ1416579.1 hypothetical protein [Salmonella enterica subsp. enterica serovar Altona]EEX2877958.1 hypothetical protein [Escherichia coli]EFH1549256.1 hypothetical protein [Escherichia coli]
MKAIILPLILAGLFSASTIAATQINNGAENNYIPIGNLSISESGFDGSSENLSKKADVLCKEISNTSPDDCFYKTVASVGNSDFNTTNIEVFKTK